MLRLNDLIIDSDKTFKNNFMLADITRSYKYLDGKKGDPDGYRYTVVLPQLKLERLSVKIENQAPLIDIEKETIPVGVQVRFTNLTTSAWISNSQVGISARADSISFVDTPSK